MGGAGGRDHHRRDFLLPLRRAVRGPAHHHPARADRGPCPERRLRVWSAGCSTGAEPYSIAILLHELLGTVLPEWRVSILATDISTAALETARAGIYGRWALRTLPPGERLRYFVPGPAVAGPGRDGTYALRPEFRRMVRFERRNLMDLLDGRAAPPQAEFDLILCRNVLIYFEADTVLGIVRALGRRLTPEGWLLIGHAEPNPAIAAMLEPVNLPGTVAYRPRGAGHPVVAPAPWVPQFVPESAPVAAPIPALMPAPGEPEAAGSGSPGTNLPDGAWPVITEIRGREAAESQDHPDGPNDLSRIRALADAGETAEAWRSVRAAIRAAPTDPVLHYYDGLLAHSLGREAEAERAWRGALYLDRAFVMAHYQLGLLMIGLGRRADAVRALDNAIRLAQSLAPDAVVAEGDGLGPHEIARSAALARAGVTGEAP